jgi:two-component system chemotaxis sensor kinase CheA
MMRNNQSSSELRDDLLRQTHTLKGTASAFGHQSLAEIAGEIEERLVEIRHAGETTGDIIKEIARLETKLESDFDTIRQNAVKILGDTLPEDDILLRMPLREMESIQVTVKKLLEITDNDHLKELHEKLRDLRMIPAKRGLARSVRIIEDLIRRTGKTVDFRFEGEDARIDCNISRGLNTPLVHLFRNALSHGIESPEERVFLGKPERGRVILHVRTNRDRVILEFSDDGRGLDPDRLREAAIDAGLLAPDEARNLSESECLQLIFLPGFSTAERVNFLSGRGIGLDAVREDICKMNGTIEIDRTTPFGLRFIITIEAENG